MLNLKWLQIMAIKTHLQLEISIMEIGTIYFSRYKCTVHISSIIIVIYYICVLINKNVNVKHDYHYYIKI